MTAQTGRIALVTGASRGIGRACALALAKAGAQVIACGRSRAALEELDDEVFAATGQHATLIPFDITDNDAFDRLSSVLFERFGRIDVLVHAAAISGTLSPVTHHEPKDFDKVVAVNLGATWHLLRALEPLLRQSTAGRAIFLTTGASVTQGRAFWGPYGATKAAMETLVRAWADEIEITPIRAAIVSPGAMRTRMRAAAYPGEDPETLPLPAEIAPLILELADPGKVPPLETISFPDWKLKAAQYA
ncbi:SDR family NAD(P)-dependent oxidoreductase [Asticcacaulis taihuensis]|jgi:NAD(P)-dependent dehydrogenase (short-subunit alcohol dehydrogenase family)|uniref:NAD(P)-dependent dehydrogenase, short-chain alcohol dehydrogenase family n=1 Tax=Asticcacaulis taihuensis TaxID=260084 RepID=A0A1G4PEG6_9CAUL|nr:SDR family NAD(P)-dependent oxidoreductase [Asticcacaulis taihuensis]SCW30555.1 NAD(P)-dependent dehydrogenase, short-chain alcohol dehydrogenase family [Asticcacaulis taihuensis]